MGSGVPFVAHLGVDSRCVYMTGEKEGIYLLVEGNAQGRWMRKCMQVHIPKYLIR